MNNKDIKKDFNELNDERKKHAIFLSCLSANNTEECKNQIKTMYNEDYQNYIKQIIFGQVGKYMNEKRVKLKEYFNNSQNNYDNIINKFSILVKELNLTNSLEISILYTYLMWNGYFSKNQKLNYQIENRALIEGMYSYDIMNGNGVCLNFSDMLKDILIKCGYNSSILLNKVQNKKEMRKFYVPEIRRNIINSHNPINKIIPLVLIPIINKMGNHAFNLIEDKGKLYIYDSTNLIYLELDSIAKAKVLAGEGDFKLTPYFSYVLNGEIERKSLDILHTTDDLSSPYSKKNYIFTSENCVELFNQNEKIIKDYYSDINNDILKIANTVDYYKKNKSKILKYIK